MLTIFNRRELAITMDMQRQSEIRGILASNDIKYVVRTHSPGSSAFGGRGRMGSFNLDSSLLYEYKIYVHRDDYERALSLIGGR